jgi:hypothetical protein
MTEPLDKYMDELNLPFVLPKKIEARQKTNLTNVYTNTKNKRKIKLLSMRVEAICKALGDWGITRYWAHVGGFASQSRLARIS